MNVEIAIRFLEPLTDATMFLNSASTRYSLSEPCHSIRSEEVRFFKKSLKYYYEVQQQ